MDVVVEDFVYPISLNLCSSKADMRLPCLLFEEVGVLFQIEEEEDPFPRILCKMLSPEASVDSSLAATMKSKDVIGARD